MGKMLVWIMVLNLLFSGFTSTALLKLFGSSVVTEKNKVYESEKDTKEGTLYTEPDIYLDSFECGYISHEKRLPNRIPVIIENEEQLAYAEENYGLVIPEELLEYYLNHTIAEAYQTMKADYPIDKYTYVIRYDEVSSGGYYLHADGVLVNEDTITFDLGEESYTPDENDVVAEVMGGFCHMAAIPKEYLEVSYND